MADNSRNEIANAEDYEYDLFDVAAGNEPFKKQSEVEDFAADEPALSADSAEPEDEKTISSDLIRGHINTIILRALYDGDKYGYEILADIEHKSHGQYALKQPSLYSALKRLEREGYITSYWGGSVGGGRRKYFSLTDEGKNISERNQTEWEYSRTVIDSLISDKDFDFENNDAPSAVNMRVLRQSTTRVMGHSDTEHYEETPYKEEAEYTEEPVEDDAFIQQRAAFEEERQRIEEELRNREEELRSREELFRAEEEQRNKAIAEQAEQARLAEEARLQEEARRIAEERAAIEAEARRLEEERILRAEEARLAEERALKEAEEERARLKAEIEERARLEEERAHAAALQAEKERQNARIVEMEAFTKERAQYEKMLRDQESEFKARHEKELAEQERRIRAEDEILFRQREQQMIHQNYLNLVNVPTPEEAPAQPLYTPENYGAKQAASNPETERGYRSVIQKLYAKSIKEEPEAAVPATPPAPRPAPVEPAPQRPAPRLAPVVAPAVTPPPKPAPSVPASKTEPKREKIARPIGKIDFYDLETRAAQDGIRISTAGGRSREVTQTVSYNLVHKGRALFFSALVVFLLCIAEGSLTLGFQNSLNLPRFYPYFIWGTGLALLLVTGLAYVNHYGERALRSTGNLLVNTIVSYALCVIVILIVALAVQIDFGEIGQLTTYIIIPAVYFFGIIVFGLVYYMQIRPNNED